MAKPRKEILPVARAAPRDLPGKILDDERTAPGAPAHLGPRQRFADNRYRCRHHINEGPFDLFQLWTEFLAEERRGRKIKRQLLDSRVEPEFVPARPVCQASHDAGIKLLQIGLHRPRLERDREGASMYAVLVEIEEHQAARKQQVENA